MALKGGHAGEPPLDHADATILGDLLELNAVTTKVELTGDSGQVGHVHCERAQEFIEALSARGEYFGGVDPPAHWIFRGVRSDKYTLVPSAFRENENALLHRIAAIPDSVQLGPGATQVLIEASALWHFSCQLNEHGLPISEGISRRLERFTKYLRREEGAKHESPQWPTDEVIPLMALAQHYGLPTRLLDWSRSSLAAAYFAVRPRDTNDEEPEADRVGVWALDPRCLEKVTEVGDFNFRIMAIEAPRASNPNLFAQDGLFTVTVWHGNYGNPDIDRLPLEEIAIFPAMPSGPILWQFTLPRAERPKALWLLAKERVTAARMFPGPRGVVKELTERLHWERPR